MSIEGIIVGLLAVVIGAAWAFYGLRLFTILLPIWAAFAGLLIGAQLGQDIFGQGFFATIVSWGIAIVVAVAFAVISYFWYYAAVTLAVGVLGYTLGVGFMAWLGIGDGFLAILLGLVVGGLFAAAAFVLGVPAWLAVAVVVGALAVFQARRADDASARAEQGAAAAEARRVRGTGSRRPGRRRGDVVGRRGGAARRVP